MYNKNFIFEASQTASQSLQLIEESNALAQPTIGADFFEEAALENKLTHDGKFLLSLNSVLEESQQEIYFEKLGLLLEATQDLFIEINAKPRTISHAVDTQELTENVSQEIYAKNFTEAMHNKFSLPLFEGTLLQDYKDKARLLTESVIASNLTADIDNELFIKYSLFENTLVENTFSIIIPQVIEEKLDLFIGQQDDEYFNIFEKNAQALKETIYENIQDMVSMIAPKLFEESAGLKDSGCEKFAGISKALKH